MTFETRSDRVVVAINGKPFTNLYYGKDANKRFLHPLTSATGKIVTRGIASDPVTGDRTDNPHQRGVWVGSELLNGTDFWENNPSYQRTHMGKIEFKDLTAAVSGKDRGTLSFLAKWITEDGRFLVAEKQTVLFYAQPNDCRMFDVDLELEGKQRVRFEDHADNVIGIRLGLPFDDHYGGKVANAQGIVGSAVRGARSEWADWMATVGGEKVGVAIFDHPLNLNYPCRWNVKLYGIMFANPFGQHAFDPTAPMLSYTLEPGKKIHLRYRFLVHPIGTDLNRVAKNFADSHGASE